MRVLCSWVKSRKISESIETMAPATLDGVLQKSYLKVRKQDGSEYVFPVVASLPPKKNVCELEQQNDFHDLKPFVLMLANQIKG